MQFKRWSVLKAIAPVLFLLALIIGLIVRGPGENGAAGTGAKTAYPLTGEAFSLDTYCSISIYAGGGEAALSKAMDALSAYDDLLNPLKEGSDIYKINHRTSETVELQEETARMLSAVRKLEQMSGGDFEPVIAPLTDFWDIQHRKKAPAEAEVAEKRKEVVSGAWEVKGTSFYAYAPALKIDIGAFAKGFIADRLRDLLRTEGVTSAVISLGGNVLCLGEKPDGEPFRIGLKKPERGSEEYLDVLDINDLSVVTAGIYERYFEEDGVIYHHILDPKTGWPVQNELAAVTVVGPSSELCDALSTTLFIKGEKDGTAFLSEWNEQEGGAYSAYFIRRGGHYTKAGA